MVVFVFRLMILFATLSVLVARRCLLEETVRYGRDIVIFIVSVLFINIVDLVKAIMQGSRCFNVVLSEANKKLEKVF